MTTKKNPATQRLATESQVSEDSVLKIAKEIAVKFIEVGRLTPATFDETFKSIHQTIKEAIQPDD